MPSFIMVRKESSGRQNSDVGFMISRNYMIDAPPFRTKYNKLRRAFMLFLLVSMVVSPFLGATRFVQAETTTELLPSPWSLSASNGASEKYQAIDGSVLKGKESLRITYNLHGMQLLGGDASAVIFDQDGWKYASLSEYGQNGKDGDQTVDIPLTKFGIDMSKNVGILHSRIWSDKSFTVDIKSVKAVDNDGASSTSPATPTSTPTPLVSPMPSPSTSPVPEATGGVSAPVETVKELLPSAWTLSRTTEGAVEKYQIIDQTVLANADTVRVTYNLHGLKALGKDASALVFDQNGWRYVSLSNYGQNGKDGDQTVDIPLADFGLNASQPVSLMHSRFWNDKAYTVDIKSVKAVKKGGTSTQPSASPVPSTTPAPTATPAPTTNSTPVSGSDWDIQSVSSMKETKDKICGQDDSTFINKWLDKAKELGANYVAVETPYQNPACGDALAYTKNWISAIRAHGMKVWHRHMHLAFEGIYDTPKNTGADYNGLMAAYIKNNPDMFAEGDIFTPQPEPQNGGIQGITYCSNNICIFNSKEQFNQFLRDGIDKANDAFNQIGKGGKLKIGYYGFDGFVAWGSQNPDWHGILEDATVAKMGNIAIDHYPELIGDTMDNALTELQARYPGVPIFISEWGSAGSTDPQQQVLSTMGAAKKHGVIGFNYWHMGMGGNEALINSDFTNRSQFDEVQSYFTGKR